MEDFLPLQLISSDVILKMQWLRTLGGMQTNWEELTIRFKIGDIAVTMRGDPSLSKTQISLKAIMKSIQLQGGGFLVKLGMAEVGEEETEGDPTAIF